ncbi:hypothetical protein [Streptomyces sasae]|uniref:hypothetical protein n=1 Tax=Streptomyces sasae TaxID=1266772 RepID=UPI0029312586|nr:hypothetical protein [Streptomyces sasae]
MSTTTSNSNTAWVWTIETKQVLEVGAGSTENGAAISQWMPLNHSYQAWTIQ